MGFWLWGVGGAPPPPASCGLARLGSGSLPLWWFAGFSRSRRRPFRMCVSYEYRTLVQRETRRDEKLPHHQKKQAPEKHTLRSFCFCFASFLACLFYYLSFLSFFTCLYSLPSLFSPPPSPHTGRRRTAASPPATTESFPQRLLNATAAPALHRHGLWDATVLRICEPRNHHARQNCQEAHALDRAEQTGGARCVRVCVECRVV